MDNDNELVSQSAEIAITAASSLVGFAMLSSGTWFTHCPSTWGCKKKA